MAASYSPWFVSSRTILQTRGTIHRIYNPDKLDLSYGLGISLQDYKSLGE
ncbi:MAG: hypothetical protein R3321_14360 [Nitrososphaeraceae archaeon]|nr:hypothetical protein [Nitrososphaeraceae archaeon]